jgi:hypothetical protein
MEEMSKLIKDLEALNRIYEVIGLSGHKENPNGKRMKKHQQIEAYLAHLAKAVGKLSTKRQILLVDCACGKSYLSFVAYYYLKEVMKRDIKIIGIDYNDHVIKQSKIAATTLGYNNMEFICDDIFNVNFEVAPDIVYSLHACDIATDMTMAKGILENSKYIMTVSCCQHTMRSSMKKHGLSAVTRHGIYKERLTDMVGDSMRALLLESKGYKVEVFDYVATSETPKNVMVRATKIGTVSYKKSQEAMVQYQKLEGIFNANPALEEFLR